MLKQETNQYDLIKNTKRNRSLLLSARHRAVSNLMKSRPNNGNYELPFKLKLLKGGSGIVRCNVSMPGVIFTATHICVFNRYFKVNADIPRILKRHKLAFYFVLHADHKNRSFPATYIESLIKLGFDINTVKKSSDSDIYRSVFSLALACNRPDIANMALKNGADPFGKEQYLEYSHYPHYGEKIYKNAKFFLRYIEDENERTSLRMKLQIMESE